MDLGRTTSLFHYEGRHREGSDYGSTTQKLGKFLCQTGVHGLTAQKISGE